MTNPEFKDYIVSNHAARRAMERLNVPEVIIKDYLTFMLQSARDCGEYGNTRSYLHEATNTYILVDLYRPVVVTVYGRNQKPLNDPKIQNTRLQKAMRAELAAMRTESETEIAMLKNHIEVLSQQAVAMEQDLTQGCSDTIQITLKTAIDNILNSLETFEAEIISSTDLVKQAESDINSLFLPSL